MGAVLRRDASPRGGSLVEQMKARGIDPEEFDKFLRDTGLDEYRGQIAPKNEFRGPWVHKLDVRFQQEVPAPKGRTASQTTSSVEEGVRYRVTPRDQSIRAFGHK